MSEAAPSNPQTTVETRLVFKSELDAEIERRKRLEEQVISLGNRVAELEKFREDMRPAPRAMLLRSGSSNG